MVGDFEILSEETRVIDIWENIITGLMLIKENTFALVILATGISFVNQYIKTGEEINYYLEDFKTYGKLDCFNEYGVDLTNPFEGLFVKRGKRYKYTINHTKKVYYSLDETAVLYPDHTSSDFLDPLPILMGYGRVTDPGEWIGDIIGVSDQRPDGYEPLLELQICN